jgi:nickel-dependent lactate racemase
MDTFKEFHFPYGNSFLTARIPAENIACVLERKHARGLADEAGATLEAMRHPIASPPLKDCINKGDKVVVIVTDNTRPCPDDCILPPLLAEIESKIPKENITIIVALGLHTPLTREEIVIKLGKNIVSNYKVLNHDPEDTVNIGTTSRSIPVEVSRRVMEADFRISTGFIEPHFFAGFSGGSKSIMPGISGAKAIYHNHGYEMLDHPLSRAGITKGNPIFEDIVEQGKMAGLNFIVNVLLNEKHQITHVVAGDPVQAHEQGCRIERELAGVEVGRKVDIVVTTNSGAPLDLDLYQTVKGIDSASLITRQGGIILIASACDRGAGPDAFTHMHLSAKSPAEVLTNIQAAGHRHLPWQNQRLAQVQLNNDIYLVSGLDDTLVKNMMLTPVANIEEGLKKAFQKLGKDALIAVIPQGHMVLPMLRG